MCVDYTDLNKHCPKDAFGLPRIYEVVDSIAGYELLFFLEGDLVITEVIVKEGEQFAAGGGVYKLVYPRQTEGVFRAVFVEIGVINKHSPFFILLLNKD